MYAYLADRPVAGGRRVEVEGQLSLGAKDRAPEIDTSEIMVDCCLQFPVDCHWSFPTDFTCFAISGV